MKKLISLLVILIVSHSLQSQNISNPYASIGKKKPKVATVTNGTYNEFYIKDSLVLINDNAISRKTGDIVYSKKDNPKIIAELIQKEEDKFRFLSTDPLTKEYPELTPYQFASNSPIVGIDRDGLEIAHYSLNYSNGKPVLSLIGIQMRAATHIEQLAEGFGIKYTPSEYSGDLIDGLSFKVFYNGAEFTFNTVGELSRFAKSGEENANGARAAYLAGQVMIAVAVTDMKQLELKSEEEFVEAYSETNDDFTQEDISAPINSSSKQQKASNNGVNSNGAKQNRNIIKPIGTNAQSAFKLDKNGKISRYTTYETSIDKKGNKFLNKVKTVDVDPNSKPHYDKKTGKMIPAPHTTDEKTGDTKPADSKDLPK